MIPENILKQHILSAIEEIERDGVRSGRQSSTYDLKYNGKFYPPKLVVSLANKYANGEELDHNSFRGGLGTKAFTLLERYNFEIVTKPERNKMNNSHPISKAIEISKMIILNGLRKASIRRGTAEHDAYTNQVKPLIDEYKNEFNGKSPNLFLKSILEIIVDEFEFDENYEIRNFKYWGRILQPYVWACISLKDKQNRGNPASYSPQLYLLIDDQYIRYGFCYGDYLKNDDPIVSGAIQDDNLFQELTSFTNSNPRFDFYVVDNEGIIEIPKDKVDVSSNEDLKSHWGPGLHLSGYITPDQLAENSIDVIKEDLIQIVPFFKQICDLKDDENEASGINIKLVEESINKYIYHCETTSWLKDEKYKFNFSKWVDDHIDISNQSDKGILELARESQKQKYSDDSNILGVNFILTEKRFQDDFISIADIVYLRDLVKSSHLDPEPKLPHSMTYPKISVWAACMSSGKFIPYASAELYDGLSLINNGDTSFPKKGYKAFQYSQILLHQLVDILKNDQGLPSLYEEHLGRNLSEVDWAWITQDFNLFLTRVMSKEKNIKYWLFAPGRKASKWEYFYSEGIMAIGWDSLGDLKQYDSKEEIVDALANNYTDSSSDFKNDSLCCYEFTNTIKKGDIVFCKEGRHSYLGYGVVTSDYQYDPSRDNYTHIRKMQWIRKGLWPEKEKSIVLKTLTDITKDRHYVERLKELLGMKKETQKYTIADATSELFMPTEDFNEYLNLLKTKKNIVLQGPPGVGKTFVSKRLAYCLLGDKDDSKVKMIQFHQSYAYEDFIQGFRPTKDGDFKLTNGVFYNLCSKAEGDPDSKYVLVIDEINRGNLSKIFGELLMLIESDKRGQKLSLTYSPDANFSVPKNLFLIGTMNTADRSIAMVDYALRRRFSFISLSPQFNEKYKQYLVDAGMKSQFCDQIINGLNALNNEIKSDKNNLGDGYQIGHSYFCPDGDPPHNNQWFNNKIKYEIEPLLKEYWFDEPERVESLVESLTL